MPFLLLTLLMACAAEPVWPDQGWVLDDVTLVDGQGGRSAQALVLAGDSVWAVMPKGQDWPPHLPVTQGGGRWVIPGLIDSHVHLAYSGALAYPGELVAENVEATLAWGVVGVVDVGGPLWTLTLRDALNQGRLPGPRALATGPFLTVEGSHPCELAWDRELCRFIDGDAAEQGQALLDQGADGLKVALSETGIGTTWPRLDPHLIEELVALGAPVFVHVASARDAEDAEPASHLAHTPFASPLGRVPQVQSIHSTIGANAGILRTDDIPTTVPAAVAATWRPQDYPAWSDAALEWTRQARENLALLVREEAPVVAGSDAGYYFVPHGYALHLELQELVAAGMRPEQALAAATSIPAQIYGFEGLGCLDAGCEASFLVLDSDPLSDIANTTDIAWIVHQGLPPETFTQGDQAFCLSDADCPERCDVPSHRCEAACTAWDPLNACGSEAWCAPTDTQGLGVCHRESSCDWRAQDCGGPHGGYYGETCVPADLDTGYCWPSGDRGLLESCDYGAARCEQGLYCSPVSALCLELCEGDADCSWGSCQWQRAGSEDWFGLCY